MIQLLIFLVFIVLYYGSTAFLIRKAAFTTRNLCICSICIAMTLVLEFIQIPLPTGNTISLCSSIPLMLLAIVLDYRLAIVSGWVCGILAMFFIPAWQIIHIGQPFAEHLVCFSCLGFAGIFGQEKRWKLLCGIGLASCIQFFGHVLSGVLFFSQNAWNGFGAWGYSLIYNISQLPVCILSGVLLTALPLKHLKHLVTRTFR